MTTLKESAISGYVADDFGAVGDAFAENFRERNELGAACSVYHHGKMVVDLRGGVRDRVTGESWEESTMVIIAGDTVTRLG